jgi:hypothetical protein
LRRDRVSFAGVKRLLLMTGWRLAFGYAVTGGVPRRSLAAAIVVGTILNLINQGDALFAGRSLDWLKLLSTYIVPYCVTTYGAVSFRLAVARRTASRQFNQDRR